MYDPNNSDRLIPNLLDVLHSANRSVCGRSVMAAQQSIFTLAPNIKFAKPSRRMFVMNRTLTLCYGHRVGTRIDNDWLDGMRWKWVLGPFATESMVHS